MTCEQRPAYPFNDQLPGAVGAFARHHLIPWKEVCLLGNNYIAGDRMRLETFFECYDGNSLLSANLGQWGGTNQAKILNGNDGLINQILQVNGEALEEFSGLLSWLPGNLVVGPTNRPNHADPGETYDDFACARRAVADPECTGLITEWQNGDSQQRFELVKELAGKLLVDDSANAGFW